MEIIIRERGIRRQTRFAVLVHKRFAIIQAGNRKLWLWRYR